eukprot:CAMPEP_0179010314 /NCGR_PEP_ID=MMETSP0796-20121207/38_1 /TAXON_ID=73915 /ORGANISM="Pyrodinium bahamense, Strain pbaha01" /LENGTH=74 /DNA_ID=CAMNT_0020705565 /DNA_START=33 /DNA_END=257 /DNA_ORIENTATION=-
MFIRHMPPTIDSSLLRVSAGPQMAPYTSEGLDAGAPKYLKGSPLPVSNSFTCMWFSVPSLNRMRYAELDASLLQ